MAQIVYTPDQMLAINTEGCDILVSAAAGSGKTAVLTRRVLNKITDTSKKHDITDFLVVTFTVSAANDLKRKLSEGIREEMKAEGADIKRLRRQMLSLSYAKIATIDSFCNFIVKDCTKELSLPVGMALADEKELDALALELMEETVENAFNKNGDSTAFVHLVETFSNSRSDAALVPSLLTIYKKLLNYPEPMSLFSEHLAICKNALEKRAVTSFFDTLLGRGIKDDIEEKLEQSIQWLSVASALSQEDEATFTKYLPIIEGDIEFITGLKEASAKSYSDFAKTVRLYAPEKIPSVTGRASEPLFVKIKELRTRAKDTVKKLAEDYRVQDEEEIYDQLSLHVDILSAMEEIIKEFHARFCKEKRRRKIMSFSDMSHYTFKALVEEGSFDRQSGTFKKTPYAEELSARFKEILIDEYQDVNTLQDTIFRAISNSKNRFMVGDIKQSIYAFRGATPEIFELLRTTFKPHGGKDDVSDDAKSVFLQNNYRSDSNILDFSNALFSRLMNWEKEKYLEKDHLVFSKKDDLLHPVELTVLHKKSKGESEKEDDEAIFVANKIISLVESGEARFEDITVLARNKSTLEKAAGIFSRAHIPFAKAGNSNLFECFEVLSAISFLRAVNNPTDDVFLASAMSSLPFSFTPDELLEIRSNDKNSDFYFALLKECEKEGKLSKKCCDFVNFLDRLSDFAKENSPDRVLWRIMEETGLFTNVKKLSDAEARLKNLLTLYSLVRSLCRGEKGNLSEVCDKLDSMARDGNTKTSDSSQKNAVKLMTFHASKGLQFPIVFTMGLGSIINRQDVREKVVFSPYGPTFDLPYSKANTKLVSYMRKNALKLIEKSLIDEELRGLYVALTRAERRLFVTAQTDADSLENAIEFSQFSDKSFSYLVRHGTSLIELMALTLSNRADFSKAFTEDGSTSSSEKLITTVIKNGTTAELSEYFSEKEEEKKSACKTDFLPFAMKEVYHSRVGELPYKISVSRIKNGLLDDGVQEREHSLLSAPKFISPQSPASGAERGTAMHTFMQFTSFDLTTQKDIEDEADRLLSDGFISEEHRKNLDFEKLLQLFKSDVFARIKKSRLVEREKRYTVCVPVKKLLPKEEYPYDDNILIQGVVDCYFEEEDGSYTLIDFKTDRVKKEDGEKVLLDRHAKQLTLYAEALSEILPRRVEKILIYSFSLSKFISVK